MLGVDIRFCGPSDLSGLLALNALDVHSWPQSVIVEDFSDPSPSLSYLGAFTLRGDRLLGYAVLGDEAGEALLMALEVSPSCRRRGVGMQLVIAVAECAAARGFSSLFLRVRESNAPARALYEALGFRGAGTSARYYANGESALMLRVGLPLEIPLGDDGHEGLYPL